MRQRALRNVEHFEHVEIVANVENVEHVEIVEIVRNRKKSSELIRNSQGQRVLGRSWTAFLGVLGLSWVTRGSPADPKGSPRGPRGVPRGAQGIPKGPQGVAKGVLKGSPGVGGMTA